MKYKLWKEDTGQALILFALVFTAFCGFTALALDVGKIAIEKTDLQGIADAAALAGAQDLNASASIATSTAITFAGKNGMKATANGVEQSGDTVTVTTPYKDDSTKIEVICKRNVHHTFARVFGLTDTNVSVRAVAQNNKWAGDALPFINLDGDGEDSTKGQTLSSWNKTDPGDKERIDNNDLVIDTSSIEVNYEDGSITYKKGKDMSQIKEPLNNILVVGKTIYLFSIKHAEMSNYAKKGSKELKNGDLIPLNDVVLLECKVTAWNGKVVTLEFENSYNVLTSGITTTTDGSAVKQSSKLVE